MPFASSISTVAVSVAFSVIAGSGSASTGAVAPPSQPQVTAAAYLPSSADAPSVQRERRQTEPTIDDVIETALEQVGDPYLWGGTGPDAFDCSGLLQFAFASAGVELPRTSREQFSATKPVDVDDLQVGDLLFYGSPIYHVAMYVGDGEFVEAPNSRAAVRVVTDGLDRGDLVGIRRVEHGLG